MAKRKERGEMKTKLLGVLVEPSLYERLRVEAFERRCSVGEVVRRAVSAYLAGKDGGRRKSR
jgi:hypothetical protein